MALPSHCWPEPFNNLQINTKNKNNEFYINKNIKYILLKLLLSSLFLDEGSDREAVTSDNE